MTERAPLHGLDDAALADALRDLGPWLAVPAADGLPARVGGRLRTTRAGVAPAERSPAAGRPVTRPRAAPPRGAGTWWPQRRTLRLALVAALVGLLALAALAAGQRLGLPGLSFVLGPAATPVASPSPAPPGAPLGAALDLGEPVTLDEAAARAGFALPVPADPAYGPPDAVWFDERVGDGQVTLVWGAGPGRGPADEHGVSALIAAFAAGPDDEFLAKSLSADRALERVRVGERDGFWVEGPHVLFLATAPDEGVRIPLRIAGSALIWRGEGATIRLESRLDRAAAVAVAESIGD